jgi:carboxymethylenebutenolidase
MIEEQIEVPTADGVCDSVLFRAEDERRLPGVIFLTDIGGIREANRGVARRVAELGYVVFMPNVFYRSSRLPIFPKRPDAKNPEDMKRFGELAAPLTPEAIERDASSFVDFVSALPTVTQGPLAIVGYCFTGAMALRTAAARPDRISVAASFHGGGLCTDAATSSHLLLSRIKARLYFGHAVEDRGMPPDAIAKFDAALASWGGGYQSEVYEGAYHSWTVPDSPVFNAPQAERAFAKLTELLKTID